jgi:hypothetical protein
MITAIVILSIICCLLIAAYFTVRGSRELWKDAAKQKDKTMDNLKRKIHEMDKSK